MEVQLHGCLAAGAVGLLWEKGTFSNYSLPEVQEHKGWKHRLVRLILVPRSVRLVVELFVTGELGRCMGWLTAVWTREGRRSHGRKPMS